MGTVRQGLAFGCAALVVAALAGCTAGGGAASPGTTVTVTAPASASASASSTPAPSSSDSSSAAPSSPAPSPSATSTRVDPNAPAGQCADAHLAVSVQADPKLSGAGQRGSYVVFRNTGSGACVLKGWPGVSLVGHDDGSQIGKAAEQEGALQPGVRVISIAAGSYALALLTYPAIDAQGGAYGDGTPGGDPKCRAEAANGYRVYPPHSFRAFFSPSSELYGCSTDLQNLYIGPVVPASTVADFTPV